MILEFLLQQTTLENVPHCPNDSSLDLISWQPWSAAPIASSAEPIPASATVVRPTMRGTASDPIATFPTAKEATQHVEPLIVSSRKEVCVPPKLSLNKFE
jgi:hypothetical protein